MNNAEQEYTQALGLDIGTSRIVVARNADKKYQYDSQLNAFLTIPYSKLAESLLQRENVFHEVQGQDIVVAGNDGQRCPQPSRTAQSGGAPENHRQAARTGGHRGPEGLLQRARGH